MRCNGRRAAGKLWKWYTLKSFNPELRWTNTGSSWSMQGILKGRDLTLWHAKLILQASVSKSTGLVFSMLHWSSSSANRSHRTKIAPFLFLSLVLPEGKVPKGMRATTERKNIQGQVGSQLSPYWLYGHWERTQAARPMPSCSTGFWQHRAQAAGRMAAWEHVSGLRLKGYLCPCLSCPQMGVGAGLLRGVLAKAMAPGWLFSDGNISYSPFSCWGFYHLQAAVLRQGSHPDVI